MESAGDVIRCHRFPRTASETIATSQSTQHDIFSLSLSFFLVYKSCVLSVAICNHFRLIQSQFSIQFYQDAHAAIDWL